MITWVDLKKTDFYKAVQAFESVQDEYDQFGAADTEPRTEFVLYIEGIVESAAWGRQERPLPRTIRDWQIFDAEILGRTGAGRAARELTKTANLAGKAARKDLDAAAAWLRYR